MAYTAVAGYLPLKDETDKLRANMFYVAYTAGVTPPVVPTPSSVASASAPATLSAPASTPATTAATKPAAPPPAASRPVTFVFNGGPGAAAVWLHLAIGPKRLDMPEDGGVPKAPFHVVDNEYSWLTATDLVFIDPVNTG
jgi:carboxypeptidase C (cathepsin A)